MTPPRVALVTGGARRVGAEIVRSFAARGYDVMLHHGQSPDAAAALATELSETHGVQIATVQADLRDGQAPARIVDATRDRFGGLVVLVCSWWVLAAM